MRFKNCLALAAALFHLCLTTRADDEPAAAGTNAPAILAGHSSHGEAFNEGPRQKAYLMSGTGKVNFPITSKEPLARKFFNQGVAQLHGFWYFEAERSFRQVLALDMNCAMAYWGMAAANVNNEKRAKEFIEKTAPLTNQVSRREALWIDSLAAFYRDEKKEMKERKRELVRALENLVFEFPDDIEAKAFLAVQIWQNASNDLPITSHQAVESLLKEVFAVEPMHPAHHFRIHLWDNEKPLRALPSAARCGQSAPGIAHMWHMPGHTYSKLNRYADAAWQQEAAARVDHAHMIRDRVLPDQIHNYAHNNSWLVDNLNYVGRVRDAVDLAKNMIELPQHPKYNTLTNSSSAKLGRTALLETLLRYELWDELIVLSETVYLPATDIPEEQARRAHALGVAWLSKGDLEMGRTHTREVEAALKKIKTERQAAGEEAEARARKEKQPTDKISKAMADAMQSFLKRTEPVENQLTELKGFAALVEKSVEKANEFYEQIKEPRKDRWSRFYSLAGDHDRAVQLAREAAETGTNQVQLLANYVDVLKRGGKTNELAEAFQKLRALSSDLDLDAPIFQGLAGVARELNLPANWKVKASAPTDVGDRPDLSTLGPFRWHPMPAPEWSLSDADGKTLSLADYRGRPVLVIFYLGHGCAHCIEQLKAFSPLAKDFGEAGIAMVAVGTDSVEGLKKMADKNKDGTGFPFPLVSDASLAGFKAYRAFDDFENIPLHGTFLVDGNGLVRWQDISYEPFTEAKFLLDESRRLLSQPKPQLAMRGR